MENPATWGLAENVIRNAIVQDHYARQEGAIGLSLPRKIADALRDAGLLKEEDEDPGHRSPHLQEQAHDRESLR